MENLDLELESLSFRKVHVGISLVHPSGYYLSVNERYCEIVGRRREELIGLPLAEVNHPDYHESDMVGMRRLAAGEIGLFVTEKKYRSTKGAEIWARLTGKAVRDEAGRIRFFMGTIEDISEQKRSELRLQETATKLAEAREGDLRFRQVLDAIPDMVLVKRESSRIFWANKAFRDYYGMTNEQLRDLIDADFSLPEQTRKYLVDDALVFRTGQVLEVPEELVRSASGEVRIFHTVKSPLRGEAGEVVMTVGVSRDVTEKLAVEKAVEEQRIHLISSAKMSALGVMAGGIAHEINNPLGIIQGITANLIDEANQLPNAGRPMVESLKKIHDTSVRIAKVIKSLLFFSRSSDLDPIARTDPGQIVQDTLELCAEKFRVNGVELRVGKIARVPLDCRPTEIGQVLLNLLQNSYDAVAGSVDAWVSLSVLELPGRVVFRVEDSGRGIAPEVVARMMDPFFTTKEVGKGTGLGLSLSKGIVESHGGTLRYLEGLANTTFVVSLPSAGGASG